MRVLVRPETETTLTTRASPATRRIGCIARVSSNVDAAFYEQAYETVERHDFRVVKRNGERVGFDRDKLMGGLLKACEKRKVPYEVLERVAEEIVAEFQADNVREVPTSAIGLKVMEKLRGIDPVAYVRYASVYRQFQDVGEFIDEINAMGRRPIVDPMQQHLFPLK